MDVQRARERFSPDIYKVCLCRPAVISSEHLTLSFRYPIVQPRPQQPGDTQQQSTRQTVRPKSNRRSQQPGDTRPRETVRPKSNRRSQQLARAQRQEGSSEGPSQGDSRSQLPPSLRPGSSSSGKQPTTLLVVKCPLCKTDIDPDDKKGQFHNTRCESKKVWKEKTCCDEKFESPSAYKRHITKKHPNE